MKRLRSDNYAVYDAASRRIAWDSVMSSGNKTQIREASEARDKNAFSTNPTPEEIAVLERNNLLSR